MTSQDSDNNNEQDLSVAQVVYARMMLGTAAAIAHLTDNHLPDLKSAISQLKTQISGPDGQLQSCLQSIDISVRDIEQALHKMSNLVEERKPAPQHKITGKGTRAPRRRKKVAKLPRSLCTLVADDEIGIRELMYDILSRHGHEVICTKNGSETLEVLAEGNIDVIYLDIRMPGGDGLMVLRKIRTNWPHLHVIVITGCGQPELLYRTIELGAFACLVKPFSVDDVLGMLDVVSAAA